MSEQPFKNMTAEVIDEIFANAYVMCDRMDDPFEYEYPPE